MRLGRRRPHPAARKLRLGNYLQKTSLPPPPPEADYTSKAPSSLAAMYKNDELSCCVVAGAYHLLGVATGNAGSEWLASDDVIVREYSAIGGYNPNDPTTDQGLDEVTALQYWKANGFADGSKLLGWAAVDANDADEVRAACFLFEGLYFGVELPDAWVNPTPSAPGFLWDVGAPDVNNGHCFVGCGYDADGLTIDTWGGTLTWPALAALCTPSAGGELYVLCLEDQLAKGQSKAPNGVDWATLLSDFESLGGPGQPVP